jgi:hypothetical protein
VKKVLATGEVIFNKDATEVKDIRMSQPPTPSDTGSHPEATAFHAWWKTQGMEGEENAKFRWAAWNGWLARSTHSEIVETNAAPQSRQAARPRGESTAGDPSGSFVCSAVAAPDDKSKQPSTPIFDAANKYAHEHCASWCDRYEYLMGEFKRLERAHASSLGDKQQPLQHVCGLQGFGSELTDRCPACSPETPMTEAEKAAYWFDLYLEETTKRRQLERELNARTGGEERWRERAIKSESVPSATRRIKYVVRCGGECPQDWLCRDIPEVQKAICEALYGDPNNADHDGLGWYVEAIQKMSPEELKREWRFEDGWLEVLKLRQPSTLPEGGSSAAKEQP